MASNIIHFVHANGFPAETYRKLFECLGTDYIVKYKNLHAHAANYPVTNNWDQLVDELIDCLQSYNGEPIIGMGHSFGGILILFAALKRPELFQSIVLLDASILSRLRSIAIKAAKRFGLISRLTGARAARLRRAHWKNHEEAIEYFRRRSIFKYFEEETLYDYVYYGTHTSERGVHLKFDPRIESQIYRTLPDHFAKFHSRLKVPGALLYGRQTHVLTKGDLRNIKKYFDLKVCEVSGTHLFPFEYPEKTAHQIKVVVSEIGRNKL